MMKTGATAMLAVAALTGSAAAQDTCAPLWAQCLGPEATDNVPCCSTPGEAVACVQKNDQYAQCRPATEVGTSAPLGWMGNVLTTPTTIESATDADAEADADAVAEEDADYAAEDEEVAVVEDPVAAEDPEVVDAAAEDDAEEQPDKELEKEAQEDDDGHLHEDDDEHVHEDDDEEYDDVDASEEDGVEQDADEDQVVTVPAGETMEEAVAAAEAGPEASPAVPVATPVATPAAVPAVPATVPVVDATGAEDVMDQFINFPGFDYLPNGANLVEVMDLVPSSMASMKVANPQACEDFCAATDGCNAASYYLDGTNYGDRNCWLKTIANPCERPEDAMADANAVLLLKLDATCEAALAVFGDALAPAMAPIGLDAMAPISDVALPALPEETPEVVTTETRSLGDAASTTVPDVAANTNTPSSSDGVVSVRGALIAMAVAGAAAFF